MEPFLELIVELAVRDHAKRRASLHALANDRSIQGTPEAALAKERLQKHDAQHGTTKPVKSAATGAEAVLKYSGFEPRKHMDDFPGRKRKGYSAHEHPTNGQIVFHHPDGQWEHRAKHGAFVKHGTGFGSDKVATIHQMGTLHYSLRERRDKPVGS
jgi:hypothetical protein